MQAKTSILLFFLICIACSNANEEKSKEAESEERASIKFDKAKWRTKEDDAYPHREDMLEDLIGNHTLKGIKKREVLELLGQPDRTDSSYLFYLVAQKRIYFFPLHTKTLVIKLSTDSTVEWRKIHQ